MEKLSRYESWKDVKPLDFESLVGKGKWDKHWDNLQRLHDMMAYSQTLAEKIKKEIAEGYLKKNK